MVFGVNDTFLINRGGLSYTMTAPQIKSIVNPEGIMQQPSIIDIIDFQGYPVELSTIELTKTISATEIELTLEDDTNLDLITAFPEEITLAEPYIPITTSINKVEVNGSEYTLRFNAINYDLSLFQVGNYVKTVKDDLSAEIKAIDSEQGTITIESVVRNWITALNDRLELDITQPNSEPITAKGTLTTYTMNGTKPVLTVTPISGTWMNKYNNRNKKNKIHTTLPRGGYEVDANGFTFKASPFFMGTLDDETVRDPVLKLQEVTWRINGTAIVITDPDPADGVVQTVDVGPGILFEQPDKDNYITVTYKSGNYRETSERVYFRSSITPKTSTTSSELYSRVVNYKTEVTSLNL